MRTSKKLLVVVLVAAVIGPAGGFAAVRIWGRPERAPIVAPPATVAPVTRATAAIQRLPGYGELVTQKDRTDLEKSLVQIVRGGILPPGQSPDAYYWGQGCTGLKISLDGGVYVLTAAHCFTKPEEDPYALVPGWGSADSYRPADFPAGYRRNEVISKLGWAYGVAAAGDWVPTKVARLSSIALRIYPDIALLTVKPNPTFDAIPAYPYAAGGVAKPGAEAVLASLPDTAVWHVVRTTGWYVGSAVSVGDPLKHFAYVAINPTDAPRDACQFGASGSIALIAGGLVTGPLSNRINATFPDSDEEGSELAQRRNDKADTEKVLHLKPGTLAGYSTVCGYSVATEAEVRSLLPPGRSSSPTPSRSQ